jgi:hypothetical protein
MRFALVLFVTAIGGSSGCSLVLDFSDPPGPADASVPDAVPAAACDFGEANDTRTTAHTLAPISGQAAGICDPGDRDFFAIQVVEGQTMTFTITFAQDGSHGDLDMRLLDGADAIIARSLSTDADEGITCPGAAPSCPALAAGNYFIEIFGFADSTVNGYTIDYTLTGP